MATIIKWSQGESLASLRNQLADGQKQREINSMYRRREKQPLGWSPAFTGKVNVRPMVKKALDVNSTQVSTIQINDIVSAGDIMETKTAVCVKILRQGQALYKLSEPVTHENECLDYVIVSTSYDGSETLVFPEDSRLEIVGVRSCSHQKALTRLGYRLT